MVTNNNCIVAHSGCIVHLYVYVVQPHEGPPSSIRQPSVIMRECSTLKYMYKLVEKMNFSASTNCLSRQRPCAKESEEGREQRLHFRRQHKREQRAFEQSEMWLAR